MAGHGSRHTSVTVIVRAHNAEATLSRALNCLAAQTLADIQMIVVDEGSVDGTAQILARAAERDVLLECVRIDGGGPAASFGLGLQRARGRYVFLMDASDTIASQTLRCLYELAVRYDLDLAMPGRAAASRGLPSDDLPTVYATDAEFHMNAWRYLKAGILADPCGKLYRAAHIQEAGAVFGEDGGVSFVADFLRDAHGVAYDGQAIYNPGEQELARAFGWDASLSWTEEGRDALGALFAHWGLEDDPQSKRALQRYYAAKVLSSILFLSSSASGLSKEERTSHVQRVIGCERAQQAAEMMEAWPGASKAMRMPIRRKAVSIAMGEGRILSWISRHSSAIVCQIFD